MKDFPKISQSVKILGTLPICKGGTEGGRKERKGGKLFKRNFKCRQNRQNGSRVREIRTVIAGGGARGVGILTGKRAKKPLSRVFIMFSVLTGLVVT